MATGVCVTNAGVAILTNRIIQAGTAPKYQGWGTGTTTPDVTDTALQTEAAPTTAGGRTTGTESRATVTVANDAYQVSGTITATGTVAITEYGQFDAASGGNMLIHAVHGAQNLSSGDAITYTSKLKIAASGP